jgi:SAM-dependent methyltransferase
MTDSRAAWYQEWFNEIYLEVYAHRNEQLAEEEAEFLIEILSPSKQDRILDLCCGAGRHLRQLQARGYCQVIGIDLSATLLQRAVENGRMGAWHAPLPLVRGDMRALPFRGSFQIVASFFTSFGYFQEENENLKVLKEIQQALTYNGRFLIDLVPLSVVERLIPRSERMVGDLSVIETRSFNSHTHRIEKQIQIHGPEGEQTFYESVRVYSFGETKQMLAAADLCLTEVYGDFKGGAFHNESERMILIGCRGGVV